MLRRLVTWSYDRRRTVLTLWIAGLVAAGFLAGTVGGDNEVDFTVPGSDSADAIDLLDERFPDFAGGSVDIVYKADAAVSDAGVTDPVVATRMEELTGAVSEVDHVISAQPGPVSADGETGVVQARFDLPGEQVPAEPVEQVIDLAGEAEADVAGLQVELGGYPIEQVEQSEAGSENLGVVMALVILLIAFGSALAAGLPLVIAGFGLALGLSLTWLLANELAVPDFGNQLAMMIGIGVGIDYALFIVTRFRSGLAEGAEPRQAAIAAGTTSGRAVVFAGTTVVISLMGLGLMGREYLWGTALSTSFAVLSVVLASATILPALLGFTGRSIDRLRMPWFRHDVEGRRTLSWRWSRVMQRRPLLTAALALAALLAMTAPVTELRLGMPDAGTGPTELTSRRAYDLMSEGFGPGANGPLIVAVDLAQASEPDAAETVANEVEAVEGVAGVLPPQVNQAGDAAVVMAFPTTGPQDEATENLVHTLRDDVLPSAVEGTGVTASVGGTTAMFIDESEFTGGRLPLLIGGVVLLSFLLLTSVFRSLAVAIKAAVMNLLSIGAAYGVMGLAANGGWLGDLIGIEEATPVPAWLPMLMFAVLFGLSMDYEVFLLSRIREEYLRTGDNRMAVADGVAKTARVITAAAAIMVTVFGAYVLEDAVFLKLAGIGLAAAVFTDATIVRMVLVPSTMELLGDRNWWLPRWLDRLLPHLDVEGSEAPEPEPDDDRELVGVG